MQNKHAFFQHVEQLIALVDPAPAKIQQPPEKSPTGTTPTTPSNCFNLFARYSQKRKTPTTPPKNPSPKRQRTTVQKIPEKQFSPPKQNAAASKPKAKLRDLQPSLLSTTTSSQQQQHQQIFANLAFYFVVGGSNCTAARVKILKTKICQYGGTVLEDLQQKVVVPLYIISALPFIKIVQHVSKHISVSDTPFVKPDFISESIVLGSTCRLEDYLITEETLASATISMSMAMPSPDSADEAEDDRDQDANEASFIIDMDQQHLASSQMEPVVKISAREQEFVKHLACQVSPQEKANGNVNKAITDQLDSLEKIYQNTGEQWRAMAYRKASSALKKHPTKIKSAEEAKNIKGIGAKTAEKIGELLSTGVISKLQNLEQDENVKTIQLFTDIFGVGPTTARQWYSKGYRTLDDIRNNAKLSHQQQIGLKYLDDFKLRIPRAEVEEMERLVKQTVNTIRPGLSMVFCGSYRRGAVDSGDVDILITDPKASSTVQAPHGLLQKLVQALKSVNFLIDDLSFSSKLDKGESDTYMGVCRLTDHDTYKYHRRIDIKVYASDVFPFALLYFTGLWKHQHANTPCARSMRWFAHKKGLSLSDKALTRVIRTNKTKVHEGEKILGLKTERDIFNALGLEYKEPNERNA